MYLPWPHPDGQNKSLKILSLKLIKVFEIQVLQGGRFLLRTMIKLIRLNFTIVVLHINVKPHYQLQFYFDLTLKYSFCSWKLYINFSSQILIPEYWSVLLVFLWQNVFCIQESGKAIIYSSVPAAFRLNFDSCTSSERCHKVICWR